MPRFRRLALLFVPLIASLTAQALPGRAQQPGGSRYAFADTLLLRDTLGLSFERLFPMADSLQVVPDSLRAWMIRWRLPMLRFVQMADSAGVPVDSVGPLIDRERFNPLAAGRARRDETYFRYTSEFGVQRTSSAWTNSIEHRLRRGAVYGNNVTSVLMERIRGAGTVNLRQQRDATTEGGLRLSDTQSIGAQLKTLLYDNYNPRSPTNEKETQNQFNLTARTQRGKGRNTFDLNLFGGYLDDDRANIEIKRGLSGRLDSRLRMQTGGWLVNDVSGAVSSNLAQSRRPDALEALRAIDLSTIVNGTLTAFAAAPVGLNVNYNARRSRVDTPTDVTVPADTLFDVNAPGDTVIVPEHTDQVITHIRQTNNGAAATVRMRVDNDRTVNVTGNVGQSSNQTGDRNDHGGKVAVRWTLRGWAIDANYGDARSQSNYPRQRSAYGYVENATSRQADARLSRSLSRRLTVEGTTAISLGRSRYELTHPAATPPSARDSYRQSYRTQARWVQSERLNTRVALEVALTRAINIDRLSSASNNDTRSYRAEWSWSYRLLPSLTASQTNQISADYQFYVFTPDRNNLSLNYQTSTTLQALLSPRFTVSIIHTGQQQPRGNYAKQSDGNEYLKLSDEAENFGLSADIRYTPSPVIAFALTPQYRSNSRSGTLNGVSVKQREDGSLNFSGRVDLNVALGARGRLSGGIARTYTDSRTTNYQNGIGTMTPRSETDYWNGSLSLTWQL